MADQANSNLFSGKEDQPTPEPEVVVPQEPTTNPSNDPLIDLLSGITNEEGDQKYANVASALSSIAPAQEHITTLESDNASLKEQLKMAKAAEELLRKTSETKSPEKSNLSQEDLVAAISSVLEAKDSAKIKGDNLELVGKAFSDAYGEKAKSELEALATANQVGVEFLKTMAETSPSAVLKLAGLSDAPKIDPQRSSGSVNSDSLAPPSPPKQGDPVMGASSTSELVGAWKAAGELVKSRL